MLRKKNYSIEVITLEKEETLKISNPSYHLNNPEKYDQDKPKPVKERK